MKVVAILALLLLPAVASAAPAATSCTACHGDSSWFPDAKARQPVTDLEHDIHAEAGLSCHDCHGGNPDVSLAEDFAAAMDPAYAPNPYRGAPKRTDVPGFCGRCHSDPAYMKRFRPDVNVDQELEYRTSNHGIGLARGDERVATCIDCHAAHGNRRVGDPRSPVHPRQVAETCRSCHADAARMTAPDGTAHRTDQYDRWRASVHAAALLERGDLSAPTCNDCHGNHGAAPPGLDSLAFVCGQCHGREASLFRNSSKRDGFERHNALYLAEAGELGCEACHGPNLPKATLEVRRFSECATCHGNHAVMRPTVALLSPLPPTPCAFCHDVPASLGPVPDERVETRVHYETTRAALVTEAAGLEGSELFDWLVDRALSLPAHTLEGAPGEPRRLRPEFARLFERFRLGKTSVTFEDANGDVQQERVVRCSDCHAAQDDGGGRGAEVGRSLVAHMQELTSLTARAERTLLAARRGGVQVRPSLLELDKAVDAQIELEALVHGFDADPESAFAQKQQQGLTHARAALEGGRSALDELGARRRGLAVTLGIIALVLVALAAKIRSLSS